jgi:hypothetical protein
MKSLDLLGVHRSRCWPEYGCDTYASPLAVYALATFLAHVSGRLGCLRGLRSLGVATAV